MELLTVKSPVTCRIARRLNRFVVLVTIDGAERRSSINNTGRLRQYLLEGRLGFCAAHQGKTDYKLFAVEDDSLAAIIDTQLQMKALEVCFEKAALSWLKGYHLIKRNAPLDSSLVDYLLQRDGHKLHLEVKSAVLREGKFAMYPDCPTERGRRHVRELTAYARSGGNAAVVFIAALPRVSAFKPYQAGDPELCRLLAEAQAAGVQLRAVAMHYNPADASIYLDDPDLPVALPQAA